MKAQLKKINMKNIFLEVIFAFLIDAMHGGIA